ncbi:MAG: hypothetical protein EPO24_00065 [Bacteroidetes bacterium]|nr:MAG: hypothetical protein EPO24_00065 [Bacteroidota bacterium]
MLDLRSWVLGVFITLTAFSQLSFSQETNPVSVDVSETNFARTGLSLRYQRLSAAEMKESYEGSMIGVHVERMSWEWGQLGFRFGGGVTGAEGTPLQIDPTWQIRSSELGFWALDLEASFLVRLTGEGTANDITPFLGIGCDVFGATEKFSVSMEKDSSVIGDASALRGAVCGHGIAGVYIPTGRNNAVQIAVKYLYSTKGGYSDLLSASQQEAFKQQIYTVMKRPTFDLTGITIAVTLYL